VIHHGTEAQKQRFLDPILRGDDVWCQGFSEPGAGSDLAALRTRGEVKGDHLVVNGQKVWTSYARYADWCILIVRTDPDVAKHRGLTFALLDMKTPGITVRPLVEMTGVAWFNEVFFDNVVIPRDMVVGEINRGWDIATTTLSHERGTATPYQRLKHHVDGIAALARRLSADVQRVTDPLARQRLAKLAIDVEVVRLTAYRNITRIMRS
jgi:alkylation response protein AidB-like acyl-CoA dehydrogenase